MKPKNKMVSFRLSADDYTRLREACDAAGVRNVSELARTAMQQLIDVANLDRLTVDAQVQGLRSKLDNLSSEIDRLSKLAGQSNGRV